MKTINKIILLGFVIINFACEDIIEEDITNDIIQIISPSEGEIISSNVVNFQWNMLTGADKYRVQVYNANQAIILDSLVVDKTTLTYPLSSGNYKWRVRGENSGYQSTYSFSVGFSLVQSNDLTNQQVVLSSPLNGLYTSGTSLTCAWQDLMPADYYELELINMTAGQTIVYQQSNITNTSVTLNSTALTQEAEYRWKIRGINTTSQTQFSSRNFFIDRTNPNQSQNSLPANNSTQIANQAIAFSWTTSSDTGTIQSPISYSIEFSNTNTFANIIQSSNSTTASIQLTFTTAGEYYWRVKATDITGNNSVYSTPFKFTI